MPKEQTGPPAVPLAAAVKGGVATQPTDARHLAMNCIEVVNDRQIIEAAVRRIDVAKTYPSWIRGRAQAGYISKDKPLIVPGVETVDISKAGTNLFALNHDIYASNPTLVADMRLIIEKRAHPPDKRSGEFEQVASENGIYWRLRP